MLRKVLGHNIATVVLPTVRGNPVLTFLEIGVRQGKASGNLASRRIVYDHLYLDRTRGAVPHLCASVPKILVREPFPVAFGDIVTLKERPYHRIGGSEVLLDSHVHVSLVARREDDDGIVLLHHSIKILVYDVITVVRTEIGSKRKVDDTSLLRSVVTVPPGILQHALHAVGYGGICQSLGSCRNDF